MFLLFADIAAVLVSRETATISVTATISLFHVKHPFPS
jgi:hypothetical protein